MQVRHLRFKRGDTQPDAAEFIAAPIQLATHGVQKFEKMSFPRWNQPRLVTLHPVQSRAGTVQCSFSSVRPPLPYTY